MATVIDTLVVDLVFKGDRQAFDRLNQNIKNVQQNLDRTAKRFAIIGTAGTAALGLIGKAGLDTEEALLRTRAALGLTEDQMKTLREEALRVGSTLPLNTKDIVNAQLAYGRLGATFEEIIRDAPAIAGAAVATGLQPEQVAQYAQIVQNVFGGDINENLDVMLRLANRSPATFQAFGESLQFSGQSAADAGLDFKTYVATLGGVAGAGRSVESVAQGLTGMWARLAKSGEGIGRGGMIVTEAFEGVGISMTDVNAAMDGTREGFISLLELINDADLTTTQLTALLSTLAGDTYSASISFAVQNPEKIRELLDEAALAPGEVVRQQEIILSGASGGIKEMMALIDTLLNRLSQLGVLTAIERFVRGVSSIVTWLTKINEEDELVNKGFLRLATILLGGLTSLLAVGVALKALSFALGGFTVIVRAANGVVWLWRNALLATRIQMFLLAVQTKLSTIATWLNTTATTANTGTLWGRIAALLASRAAILAGVVATGAATAAQWALNTAMYANPIGLIIAAVIALAAGLFFLVKKVDVVRNAFVVAFNWVKDNWPLLLAIITGPVGLAVYAFVKFKDDIIGVFASVKDFIIGVWQSIWDFILGIINRIKNAPAELLESLPGGKFVQKALVALPGFAAGGVVPGPVGRAQAAIVHGGEMVLPQPFADNMQRLLEGGVSALAGPAPGMATAMAGGGVPGGGYTDNRDMSITISEGAVVVHAAPGQDAAEIGEVASQKLRAEIRAAYRAFDSGIHR